jgi:hypothetical protein
LGQKSPRNNLYAEGLGATVSVLVSDPSGRWLGRQECAAQPGGQYKVSLEGLRPGLYFYEVVAGGQSLAAGRLVVH